MNSPICPDCGKEIPPFWAILKRCAGCGTRLCYWCLKWHTCDGTEPRFHSQKAQAAYYGEERR